MMKYTGNDYMERTKNMKHGSAMMKKAETKQFCRISIIQEAKAEAEAECDAMLEANGGTPVINIATHNGTITIQSNATGDHRTFQIRTQKKDAKFAPGKRIASLLSGSDNNSDYQGFGFVTDAGKINLWSKKHTPIFEKYATMLEDPARFAGKAEYLLEGRCRICNRKLTTPESIESGIGPVCAGR